MEFSLSLHCVWYSWGEKKGISGVIQDLSSHVQSLTKFWVLVSRKNLVFFLSLKMSPAGQRHWLMGKVSPIVTPHRDGMQGGETHAE